MMNSLEFSKLCKELHSLSETVTIETTIDYVRFSVEGEVGSGAVEIKTSEGGRSDDKKSDDVVTLSFALRYLNMFNKACGLTNSVKLMMAPDTPLVVEFDIAKLGSLKYYLAPKISEGN